MKTWCLLASLLAGCFSNEPDLDATGTVQSNLTWATGSCRKAGTEAFTVNVFQRGRGDYDITMNDPSVKVHGFVMCGPEYCEISVSTNWGTVPGYTQNVNLTVDSKRLVTGTGEYREYGSNSGCSQNFTITGYLR